MKRANKKTIFHIIWSFTTGGAETMLVNILNEQVKSSYNIHLIIINNMIDEALIKKIDKRVYITRVNRTAGSRFNINFIIKLNYLLFKYNNILAIHAHNSSIIRLILPLFWSKCVLTIHTTNCRCSRRDLIKYKNLYSISESVAKEILERFSLNTKIIFNGIDFGKIKNKSKYIKHSPFRMVQIGRLSNYHKGHDVLLNALSIIVKTNKNIQLDIIGEGDDLHYLVSLVSSLGLNNNVSFLGLKSQEYIFDNLCNYDLLVQPSYFEGFGLTAVEGIAAKIPVLVSNIEGLSEIVANGKFGYVFTPGSIEQCANTILKIIESTQIQDIINSAYTNAIEKYSVQNTSYKLLNAYENL